MKRLILLMWILLIGAMLVACAAKDGPEGKPEPPKALTGEARVTGKETWEKEWDATIAAARKEGKVVIYSGSSPAVREAQGKVFRERFGITLETIPGTASQLAAKIMTEYRASIFSLDIYAGGANTTLTMLKPGGVLAPLDSVLVLPEVLDPKAWHEGKFPFVDEAHTTAVIALAPATGFVINTTLVKPGEINSYRDLLSPKWKGKIIMADPTRPPGGDKWFSAYVHGKGLSLDYMRAFAKQEPFISNDRRLAAEWLSKGKYPISIGTGWGNFMEFTEAGTPIKLLNAEEGDYLTAGAGALALMKKTPHPNATKVFINWFFSKEGATVTSRAYDKQSTRADVSAEGLSEDRTRQPGMKYFDGESEELYLKMPEYRKVAEEIFGPLLR